MRRLILLIVIVVFVVAVLGPVIWGFGVKAAQPPRPDNVGTIMQKKLAHAQKLLEGIALADLDKIGQQVRELSALSRQPEFQVLKTAQYELHANEFRRAIDDIHQGVKQKNLDARPRWATWT